MESPVLSADLEKLVQRTHSHPLFASLYGKCSPEEEEEEETQDVDDGHPRVIALDCEMAYTEADPMDLVRVSVVGLRGDKAAPAADDDDIEFLGVEHLDPERTRRPCECQGKPRILRSGCG